MHAEYTCYAEISNGKNQSGVCLQCQVSFQSVKIYSRYARHLLNFECLFVNYGSQYAHFNGSEVEILSFLQALVVPKDVVFCFHTVDKLCRIGIPVKFVCIWYEKTCNVVVVKTS